MTFEKSKLMSNKWFPRAHEFNHGWQHGVESGVNNAFTIYPIAMYDEGLGDPSNHNANPENASFSTTGAPNCFPESRINSIFMKFQISLTKEALHTDNVDALNFCYMPIKMAFKEDYTAIDELSSTEVQDVLEMQTEATDRQGYPLYNGVKVKEPWTNASLLSSTVPGLTTTQKMEGVTFSEQTYYQALQYMTISGKLKNAQRGLKWARLTRQHPTTTINIKIDPKIKRMNEYTFFGLLFGVPATDTVYQIPNSTQTTDVPHVNVTARGRYNEWNQDFNMKRQ